MIYRITTEIDTETGNYELLFNNLTDKAQGIDYNLAMKVMHKIFGDFEKKTGGKISVGAVEIRGDN